VITLQFDFKLISKDNERIQNRAGRYFLSAKYKAFSEMVRLSAVSQYRDKPLEGDISITIVAAFKDKRHCDCSNLPKGVLDDLQGICYLNDRQVKKLECIVLDNEPRDSFMVTISQASAH
jgi:Holliday junction resolvase RusA-like endonuclease